MRRGIRDYYFKAGMPVDRSRSGDGRELQTRRDLGKRKETCAIFGRDTIGAYDQDKENLFDEDYRYEIIEDQRVDQVTPWKREGA